jgi:hypothetical protein
MHPSGQTGRGGRPGPPAACICPENNNLGRKRQSAWTSRRLCPGGGKDGGREGKLFHIGRIVLPAARGGMAGWIQQGPRELQPYQMVTFCVSYPNAARPQRSGGFWQFGSRRQRCAGDFQENAGRGWQRASNREQGPGCADVQSSGKLKEFFAFIVTAAYKDGYCKREPRPLPTFRHHRCGTSQLRDLRR